MIVAQTPVAQPPKRNTSFLWYLGEVGKGALDSLNPVEWIRGLMAAGRYVSRRPSKPGAIWELGKGAVSGTIESLKRAAHGNPQAVGSFLPDVALSLVGIGELSAAAKGTKVTGAAARAARAAERSGEAASRAARVAGKVRLEAEQLRRAGMPAKAVAKDLERRSGAGRLSIEEVARRHRLAMRGEELLAERLEGTGRKLILDPRKRGVTAPGPDAIAARTTGNRYVVEFWDNKAYTTGRRVSGSSALEKLANDPAMEQALKKYMEKSGLPRQERDTILGAGKELKLDFKRIVTNAGGNAREGLKLHLKGIEFVEFQDIR